MKLSEKQQSDIECLGGSAAGRIVKVKGNPSCAIDFPVRVGDQFFADRYELKRTHDGRRFYVHEDYEGGPPSLATKKETRG